MKKNTIYLLFLLLMAAACTRHQSFESQLAVADSLMRHNYDSAYTMLKGMDSMAQHMPERLRMKHMLLRANAQNKAWEFFTSDSTGKTLTQYYDRKGTPNERMLAHYIKGCAYRDMGDEPMALQCFNEAVAAADTADTQCDFYQLSIIYGQMASIFKNRALPDEGLEASNMAERYAWRCNDTLRVLNIWSNKSGMLISKDRIGEALQLKEKTAQWYRRLGDKESEAHLLGQCIKWLARLGELEKAKKYMDIYETHSGDFLPNRMVKPGNEGYYNTKGTYYLELGKLDSALYFFRKLRDERLTVEGQYNAAWGLSQTFRKMGISDSMAKYAFWGDVLNDTVYSEKRAKNLQLGQALYNYSHQQQVAQRKELEAKEAQLSRRNWIIGALSATFLLTLLAFWLRFKQIKLQEASKENEILRTRVLEEAKKTNALNLLIGEKERFIHKLNGIIEENADINEKNAQLQESIEILEKELKKYRKQNNNVKEQQHINKLHQTEILAKFGTMCRNRNSLPDSKDWNELYTVFGKEFPQFLCIRERKDINDDEYQICMLTKLRFELNEIAYLTISTPQRLAMVRKRLLEKIFNTTEGGAKMFDICMQKY